MPERRSILTRFYLTIVFRFLTNFEPRMSINPSKKMYSKNPSNKMYDDLLIFMFKIVRKSRKEIIRDLDELGGMMR
jgi:hypothetical protein